MKNYNYMVRILDEAFESARGWNKAVLGYACDMLEALEDENMDITEVNLLNGAVDWKAYSYGAHNCAFAGTQYIEDYFTRLGCVFVGSSKTWEDIQAEACEEAAKRIIALDYSVNGY